MISNIIIENYKSVRQLDFEMKPINILIGANGVGKSNFIGFFKFLKHIYDQNLQLHVAEEGGSENILHFGSKNSEYVRGYISFDNKSGYTFKLKPSKDNKFFYEYEDSGFNHQVLNKKVSYTSKKWGAGNTESKLAEKEDSVSKIASEYMNSFRLFHFHDTSKTSKMRKPAQVNDNSYLREDASNLPAYLYWM